LFAAVLAGDVDRTADTDPELGALTVRVLTALGARWRSQSKHSLDLKRHLRRNLGDDNFAVRSRMSRQVDDSYVVQIEKSR
jgi:hypothetical protein